MPSITPTGPTREWRATSNERNWPGELRRLVRAAGFHITHTDYVWQTFEGISNHQPAVIARTKGLLRRISDSLERVPFLRTFGVSQVIVARKDGMS